MHYDNNVEKVKEECFFDSLLRKFKTGGERALSNFVDTLP